MTKKVKKEIRTFAKRNKKVPLFSLAASGRFAIHIFEVVKKKQAFPYLRFNL